MPLVTRTLKCINQFKPNAFIAGVYYKQERGTNPVKLTADGYYRMEPGVYEVIFNEEFTGGFCGVNEIFASNGVTFHHETYSTPQGTATLMTVTSGYMLMQPGVKIYEAFRIPTRDDVIDSLVPVMEKGIEDALATIQPVQDVEPKSELLLEQEVPVKKKLGRPFKKKEETSE